MGNSTLEGAVDGQGPGDQSGHELEFTGDGR